MTRGTLRLSPGLRTRSGRTRARTPGQGQAQSTSPEQRHQHYVMLALQSARFTRNMCDLVSHSSSGTSWLTPRPGLTTSAPAGTTSRPAATAGSAATSASSRPSASTSPSTRLRLKDKDHRRPGPQPQVPRAVKPCPHLVADSPGQCVPECRLMRSSASGRWSGRGSAAVMVRVPVRKVAIVRPWATTGASALRGVTRAT